MTTAAVIGVEGKHRAASNGDAILGLLLVAPILVTMAALVFFPLVQTVWDSLHRLNPMQPGMPFIGLTNYVRAFSDGQLRTSWINTFTYVAIAVTVETIGGVLAAALINQVTFGRKWLLAAVVLPWALPGVVTPIPTLP